MQEALLQFIWQYSLYKPNGLVTTEGQPVRVLHPGALNRDAGPDFSMGRVRIGAATMVGNIEIHTRTSDWQRHGHDGDAAYGRIVLHVVFLHDQATLPGNIPLLELGPHIPKEVLDGYAQLIQTPQPIPCAGQLDRVKEITKESWLNRMLVSRWERRLGEWQELLEQTTGDWRTLLYWRLAANMGFKVNATPFLLLAKSLPLNVLGRHHRNLLQLEALLFGQAGWLAAEFTEEWPQRLKTEYEFLRTKYDLSPIPVFLWKFLRMRPANFPSLRLAQFAALLHRSGDLFSNLLTVPSVKEAEALFSVKASDYWDTHFRLGGPEGKASRKTMGATTIHNVLVNTIAPIRFLQGHAQGTPDAAEKVLHWLHEMPPESNQIVEAWDGVGWTAKSAADAQSLIELFGSYCSNKRCLECAIGLALIRAPAK